MRAKQQVKRISIEKPPLPQIKLEETNRELYSNIFGNGSTLSLESHSFKWNSESKIDSSNSLRKSTIVPPIRHRDLISIGPIVATDRKNPEGDSSPLSRFRSQKHIEQVESPKKFKKGYLAYQ